MRDHPRAAEFAAWFSKQVSLATPLVGEFYRAAGPRHTTAAEIVSGKGGLHGGGRWNCPGEMRVVYLSTESETALGEANEHLRYRNLPVWRGMPKVIVAVAVRLGKVLDFTDAAVVGQMPEAPGSLLAEDWRALMSRGDMSASQAISRAAFAVGIQGLIVPSKPVAGGVNLVVFPDLLTPGCGLEVLNAAELDKLGKPD